MVYFYLADGFEDMEALAPVDCLRRVGVEVTLVGVTGDYVTSLRGVTVKSEARTADLENAEMIVLPGGGVGSDNLRASREVMDAVSYCAEHDIHIAAICAAPYILGDAGVLAGKRATCFPGFEEHLAGAVIVDEPVVTDGHITTGKSAGYSIDFGLELVRVLLGDEAVEALRNSLYAFRD